MHRYIIAAIAMASMIGMSLPALAQDRQTPVRTLVLAAEPTKTFGAYTRQTNPVLQSGDSIHIYGEPGDFGWHVKNSDFRFDVVATIDVKGRNGRVTGKAEPRIMQYVSATRPDNFFFSLSVKVAGGVGTYNLTVRLRDVVSGQVVEREFPFVIANQRQEPATGSRTTAPTEVARSSPAVERAKPAVCKRYFPQVGEMVVVQCASQ